MTRFQSPVLASALLFLVACDVLHPLHSAVKRGDLDAVKESLSKGQSVDERDGPGAAPLHYAALGDHLEIAELLLSSGADVEITTIREGATPLHFAAFARSERVLNLLIRSGANVNATESMHGETSLHYACMSPLQSMGSVKRSPPSESIVLSLIKAGADPTVKNRHGLPPVGCPTSE